MLEKLKKSALTTVFEFESASTTLDARDTDASFAMARDSKLPAAFKTIDSKSKTPVIAILVTGIIVSITVSVANVDHISSVTSIFSLIGYSFVNMALIGFRKKYPNLLKSIKSRNKG